MEHALIGLIILAKVVGGAYHTLKQYITTYLGVTGQEVSPVIHVHFAVLCPALCLWSPVLLKHTVFEQMIAVSFYK